MGLTPENFKRLSRLNRDLVHGRLTTGNQVPTPGKAEPSPLELRAEALTLETLIPGREHKIKGGRFYAIERRAEEFRYAAGASDSGDVIDGPELVARYRRVLFGAGAAAPQGLSESFRTLLGAKPASVTYLDIETCGLAGEPLFLVGLMRYDGETLRVSQFLARDYSEERAVLGAFWRELKGSECLVTFNGKTFDVPTITARSAACGLLKAPDVPLHVDLLHESRRRWKRELPNCRLQTLEERICGRRRFGDIPGSEIPAAYHDFVRAVRLGDSLSRARSLRRLQTILQHNALDLVTMAELVTHLVSLRP